MAPADWQAQLEGFIAATSSNLEAAQKPLLTPPAEVQIHGNAVNSKLAVMLGSFQKSIQELHGEVAAAATAAPAVQEGRLQSLQALLPDVRRSLGAGPDALGSPRIRALQVPGPSQSPQVEVMLAAMSARLQQVELQSQQLAAQQQQSATQQLQAAADAAEAKALAQRLAATTADIQRQQQTVAGNQAAPQQAAADAAEAKASVQRLASAAAEQEQAAACGAAAQQATLAQVGTLNGEIDALRQQHEASVIALKQQVTAQAEEVASLKQQLGGASALRDLQNSEIHELRQQAATQEGAIAALGQQFNGSLPREEHERAAEGLRQQVAAQREAVAALRQEHLGAVEDLRQQVHQTLPSDQQRDLLEGLRQGLDACLLREQHESVLAELRHQMQGHAQALQLLQQQVGNASPPEGHHDTVLTDGGGLRQQLAAQQQALQLLREQVGDGAPLQAQRDEILAEARQHTDAALAARLLAETQQLQVQIDALRAHKQQQEAADAELREAVESLQLQVDGLASRTEKGAEQGAALSGMQAQLLDLQQALQLGLAQQDHALQAQAAKHQQAVGEAQETMHSRMTDAHAELQQQQRELAESVADLGAAQDAQAWQAATADLAQQLQVVAQQQAQGSARLAAQVQGLHSSHLEAAAAATSLQTQVTGQAAQLAGLEAALATLQEQVQERQQQGQRQGQEGLRAEVQCLQAEVQTLASQVEQLLSEVEHPSSPARGADVPRQLNTLQEQVEYLDTAVSGLLASRLTVVESKVQEISRSLGYPTARRTESGGEALQLAAAGDAEEAPAGSARAEPGPSKLLQLPGLMQKVQASLVQLQQQAAALQSQQQRGFTASARDVAGLQSQLSAVTQRQQQQLYTDEATAAATAAAAAGPGSSSTLESRSGAGAVGARKEELQRPVREVQMPGEPQHSGAAGPASSAEQVARLAEGVDGVSTRISRVAAEVESLSGQCVRMADLNHLLGRVAGLEDQAGARSQGQPSPAVSPRGVAAQLEQLRAEVASVSAQVAQQGREAATQARAAQEQHQRQLVEANRDIVDLAAHVQQHEAAVAELRQGLAAAHPGAAAADRGQAGHAVGGMSQAVPGMDVAALAARVQALEDQQQHLQQSLQTQLAAMDSEMHHLHSSVGSGFERLQAASGAPGVQAPGSASSRGLPAPVAGTAAATEQQGPASRGLHSPASGPAAPVQEQARPATPAQAAPRADEGQAIVSDHTRGAQTWQPEVAAVAANVAELREAVEDLNGRLFELRVEVQNLEGDVGINIASIKLKAELAQQHAEEAKLHAEEAAEAASPSKAPAEAQHGAPAPPAHAAVESVHEQLAASQQRLQAVEAGLQGLHRQLADQQAKLGALQGHPKLFAGSLEPLQQQLTQQQAAIAALQKSAGPQRAMEALQKQAAQQQAELATLREAVASALLPELHRQLLAAQEQLRELQQQSESLSSSQAQAGLPEEVEVRINKVELTVADALTEVAQQMKALEARLLPGPIVKQASGNPFAELEPGHEAASTVSQLSSPASSPARWQASAYSPAITTPLTSMTTHTNSAFDSPRPSPAARGLSAPLDLAAAGGQSYPAPASGTAGVLKHEGSPLVAEASGISVAGMSVRDNTLWAGSGGLSSAPGRAAAEGGRQAAGVDHQQAIGGVAAERGGGAAGSRGAAWLSQQQEQPPSAVPGRGAAQLQSVQAAADNVAGARLGHQQELHHYAAPAAAPPGLGAKQHAGEAAAGGPSAPAGGAQPVLGAAAQAGGGALRLPHPHGAPPLPQPGGSAGSNATSTLRPAAQLQGAAIHSRLALPEPAAPALQPAATSAWKSNAAHLPDAAGVSGQVQLPVPAGPAQAGPAPAQHHGAHADEDSGWPGGVSGPASQVASQIDSEEAEAELQIASLQEQLQQDSVSDWEREILQSELDRLLQERAAQEADF